MPFDPSPGSVTPRRRHRHSLCDPSVTMIRGGVAIQNHQPSPFPWSLNVSDSSWLNAKSTSASAVLTTIQPSAFALAWAGVPRLPSELNAFRRRSPRIGERFQHRLIKHSTICHAKFRPAWCDDDVLVTHFDDRSFMLPVGCVDPHQRHISEHMSAAFHTYLDCQLPRICSHR